MLLSETTNVVWNSRNKKHYVSLGYEFTRMGDTFSVSVKDLTKGSQAEVEVKCDYCGQTFNLLWYQRIAKLRKGIIKTDCCGNTFCIEKKAHDAVDQKYGGYSNMFYSCNDSRVSTNIAKYGSTNPFGSDLIKEKIVETNLEKYGVPYSQQNKTVREKTVSTCKQKYGVENYIELFKGKLIGENSPHWKGGVSYTRVERATYEYAQWRKEVFSRDLYTCQCCGAKNGESGFSIELNAHHILNWKDNIDLRYSINNGITLCSNCHNQFHSRYGRRYNTQEQLDEFLCLDKKIC